MSNEQPPQDERSTWEGPEQPRRSEPSASGEATQRTSWERDVITRLAFSAIEEQKRTRRWGIFFKILFFIYLLVVLWMVKGGGFEESGITDGDHTALVEIKGVIADNAAANADDIVMSLRNAYKSKGTRGIILRMNSPGGSPVQAGYVNDEIRRLRAEHPKIPVYAVVTDICASGGYYIAVAADQIYADKASIVGSIGVRMSGLTTFGFVEAMKKLGIERRELAAGEDKAMLDPFAPLKDVEVAHVRKLLDNIHQQFIKVVKDGRGKRLKGDDKYLFNGFYWTGEQAVELGLVDALGNSSYVAREVIGAEKIVDYTRHPSPFERFANSFGVVMAKSLAEAFGVTQTGLH